MPNQGQGMTKQLTNEEFKEEKKRRNRRGKQHTDVLGQATSERSKYKRPVVTMHDRDTWDKWWRTKRWNEHLDWPQGAWPVAGGGPEGGGGGVGIRWNRWPYHRAGLESPAQSPRPPCPAGARQTQRCGGRGRGAHLWGWHHRGWMTWGDSSMHDLNRTLSLQVRLLQPTDRPDVTSAVDWALKTNDLSIQPTNPNHAQTSRPSL